MTTHSLTHPLQDMRTWKQAEEAGAAVGFRLLDSRDVALASQGAVLPWYMRLGGNVKLFRWVGAVNGAIVSAMEFLRIAPHGMGDVHKMLFDTGGELGRQRVGRGAVAKAGRGILMVGGPLAALNPQRSRGQPAGELGLGSCSRMSWARSPRPTRYPSLPTLVCSCASRPHQRSPHAPLPLPPPTYPPTRLFPPQMQCPSWRAALRASSRPCTC